MFHVLGLGNNQVKRSGSNGTGHSSSDYADQHRNREAITRETSRRDKHSGSCERASDCKR